jgi:xanthosine utilization system XapX-like protein
VFFGAILAVSLIFGLLGNYHYPAIPLIIAVGFFGACGIAINAFNLYRISQNKTTFIF